METEVIPVTLPAKKGAEPVVVSRDEEFTNVKYDKVPNLKPAFGKATDGASVTAANASKLSDGAVAMILMSGEQAKAKGLTPLFRILGYSDVCKDPVEFTTAPAEAIPLAIEHANKTTLKNSADKLTLEKIDYHEINEAFSVVALANAK